MIKTLLFLSGAFFLGALPTAYLMVKRLKGTDIRTQGSGNVGATNALRVLGKGPGALVFLLDFSKGFLPVALFAALWPEPAGQADLPLLIGLAAILGHIFTPFLGFKGGKGVATGAGVLCAWFPLIFAYAGAVWLVTFILTRIVSISSLVALVSLIIMSLLLKVSSTSLATLSFISLLIAWTHRYNLARLFQGMEKKI